MELITKLGIDWKLLAAQIVNFAILAFVLFKFVYHPVVAMLEKRSTMIEKSVEDAKKSEELLKNIEAMRSASLSETEKKVGVMLTEAKTAADTMKNSILAEAQKQSDDLLKRAKLQMAEEKEKMLEEVKIEVVRLVVSLTGKILEKEFTGEHQNRLVAAIENEMKKSAMQQ